MLTFSRCVSLFCTKYAVLISKYMYVEVQERKLIIKSYDSSLSLPVAPSSQAPVIWCADGPSLVPPASMPQANPPSFAAKGSPAQFYMRRDHNFGGSASRLDRLRAHQELPPRMESFVEVEEDESGKERIQWNPSIVWTPW